MTKTFVVQNWTLLLETLNINSKKGLTKLKKMFANY